MLGRALEPFGLFWLEIDSQEPRALADLRSAIRTPICGGEQLLTVRQYRPYLEAHALDVVMVDVQWQGFSAATRASTSRRPSGTSCSRYGPRSSTAT